MTTKIENNDTREDIMIDNIPFEVIARNGEPLFYLSQNGVSIPADIMKKIINQTYEKADVQDWFLNDNFTDFPAIDEIRSELLSLIKGNAIESALEMTTVDGPISGIDLYKNNPIGEYWQQGDELVFCDEEKTIKTIPFEQLSKTMLIRLQSNIFYELLSCELPMTSPNSESEKIDLKFLKMGNASFYNERAQIHIEMVPATCNTILDAIESRNGTRLLPCELS